MMWHHILLKFPQGNNARDYQLSKFHLQLPGKTT